MDELGGNVVQGAFGVFRNTVITAFKVLQHFLKKTGIKRMRIELDEKDEGQRREKMKMNTEASEENFYVNIN